MPDITGESVVFVKQATLYWKEATQASYVDYVTFYECIIVDERLRNTPDVIFYL